MKFDEVIHANNLNRFGIHELQHTVYFLIEDLRQTKKEKHPGKIEALIEHLKKELVGKAAYPLAVLTECDHLSTLQQLQSDWNSKTRQHQLFLLEGLHTEYRNKIFPEIWNQICLDYAEALRNTGRSLEALSILDNIVEEIGDISFQRKNAEKGWTLIFYATFLQSKSDQAYCLYTARSLLRRYKEDIKSKSLDAMYAERLEYADKLFAEYNIQDVTIEKIGNSYKGKEKLYRNWCTEHRLFLNGSNDIDPETMLKQDSFHYQIFKNDAMEIKFLENFLNSLIQEFISLRWLLYDTIKKEQADRHFADDGLISENSGIAVYSIRTELLKTVYRMAYSIFDKIAYFLKHYYHLDMPNNKASLKYIWFIDENHKKPLKKIFKDSRNDALLALYWLSKDLYGYEKTGEQSPFVKQANHLRNMMEHSYLQVTQFPESILQHGSGLRLDLSSFKSKIGHVQSHNISIEELERMTMSLTLKVRNALMYTKAFLDKEAAHATK